MEETYRSLPFIKYTSKGKVGGGGGQAPSTFLLRSTCKWGKGVPRACYNACMNNGRPLRYIDKYYYYYIYTHTLILLKHCITFSLVQFLMCFFLQHISMYSFR